MFHFRMFELAPRTFTDMLLTTALTSIIEFVR